MPKCSRCSHEHYNFIPCHKAAEQRAIAEKAAAEFQPVIPQFSSKNGVEWAGDRLSSYERRGNMFWRKQNG